jgi:hypothetical protein
MTPGLYNFPVGINLVTMLKHYILEEKNIILKKKKKINILLHGNKLSFQFINSHKMFSSLT